MFIAETGAVNSRHSGPFKYYSCDDDGIIFADAVYTPVFFKSCGVGNIWHWDDRYVESKNLYRMFKPISELLCGIDFESEDFVPLDMSDENVSLFLLKGKTRTLGYVRNKNYNWQSVLRNLEKVEPISRCSFELDFVGENEISAKNVRVWEKDKTSITFDGKKIVLSDILIGTLFEIKY